MVTSELKWDKELQSHRLQTIFFTRSDGVGERMVEY